MGREVMRGEGKWGNPNTVDFYFLKRQKDKRTFQISDPEIYLLWILTEIISTLTPPGNIFSDCTLEVLRRGRGVKVVRKKEGEVVVWEAFYP